MPLKPNAAIDYVNGYLTKSLDNQVRDYPEFFTQLKFDVFRHIHDLTLNFQHPISVISGSNRSGKTSALMAIACSHYNFERQDVASGNWDRATWSKLVRFTPEDIQNDDWTYHVSFRIGNVTFNRQGFRNHASKKWSGVAKKQGQIGTPTDRKPNGGRHVMLIDLDRINPGRHLSQSYYDRARQANVEAIANGADINEYLSYILETNYNVEKVIEVVDSKIFKFDESGKKYTSFNTASGEDVLMNILVQILHAPEKSLILIDEIEIGLHPKIQRRLMQVLYILSQKRHLQFILTTHSYAILNSVPKESRIFIENVEGNLRSFPQLSTYDILTRMDCETFPVVTFYVEDEESKMIVNHAVEELNTVEVGLARLLRVVVVGSASKTYQYFKIRKELREQEHITTKAACILDGDMKDKRDGNGNFQYPEEEGLFFHYSGEAPEKMLVRAFLDNHDCPQLQYHVDNSNPHCLLEKMVEQGLAMDKKDAFEKCFTYYKSSVGGSVHFEELKEFIRHNCGY